MKSLKLPLSLRFDFSAMQIENKEDYNVQAGIELSNVFRENRIFVIEFLNQIENQINKIILYYFFGNKIYKSVKRNKFERLILTQPWCSFNAKKQLILEICRDINILIGKEKDIYPKLLRDLMNTRNLFAHGHVIVSGKEIKISYSDDSNDSILIDDILLEKIENDFIKCEELTKKISDAIGVGFWQQRDDENYK